MSARSTVAVVLALLTGLFFGRLLTPSQDFQPSSSALERSTEGAAKGFYEAVNQYLELGDPAILTSVLDPGFIDHSAIDPERDAADLVRYLASVRATYPDMRMDVAGMTPVGELVAVSVATTGGTAAFALGPVADRSPSAHGYEQLRIVDGKVAERWASQTLPPQIERFASIDLRFMAGWFVECVVVALPLQPGASETQRLFSPSFLIAGSDGIALEIEKNGSDESVLLLSDDPASATALQRGTRIDLGRQSVVVLPEGEAYRVWNTGREAASVIIVKINHLSPTTTFNNGQSVWIDPTSENGSYSAAGLLPMGTDPDRTYNVSLVRVSATPNELLPIHNVSGLELLFVVEGSLDVELHDKFAAVVGPEEQTMAAPGGSSRLEIGESITAVDQTLVSYRVTEDAPATIWFVTLVPTTTGD